MLSLMLYTCLLSAFFFFFYPGTVLILPGKAEESNRSRMVEVKCAEFNCPIVCLYVRLSKGVWLGVLRCVFAFMLDHTRRFDGSLSMSSLVRVRLLMKRRSSAGSVCEDEKAMIWWKPRAAGGTVRGHGEAESLTAGSRSGPRETVNRVLFSFLFSAR